MMKMIDVCKISSPVESLGVKQIYFRIHDSRRSTTFLITHTNCRVLFNIPKERL